MKSDEVTVSGSPTVKPSKKIFWGACERKERWGLTWRGRLCVAAFVLAVGAGVFFTSYPFLAVTERVNSDVLVVEGWVNQYAIRGAVEEFHTGAYQRVLTTGGPSVGSGGYVNDYQTSASVAAKRLKALGIASNLVQMVPSRVLERDRTYSAAVALREWFHDNNVSVHSINVITESTHARRSRLLFQKAFSSDVTVGIISVHNPDYDAQRWYRYSEGVKDVISESAAYLYARFFFHPADTGKKP